MGESHSLFIKGKKNDISVFAMEKKESITNLLWVPHFLWYPKKGGGDTSVFQMDMTNILLPPIG